LTAALGRKAGEPAKTTSVEAVARKRIREGIDEGDPIKIQMDSARPVPLLRINVYRVDGSTQQPDARIHPANNNNNNK